MKLYYNKRSNDPIYYVQKGFRDQNGKATTKNVYRIGKHSELLLSHADPLQFAKDLVKEMNDGIVPEKIQLSLNLKDKVEATDDVISRRTSMNIGYMIFQNIYKDMKLPEFFHALNAKSRASYDFNDVNRFLTYARILYPSSKLKACQNKDYYFEDFSFDYQHIERFLDVLYDNYDLYLEKLYEGSNHVIQRDTSVCYFDCSNFYTETEKEDPDYVDEVTGEVIHGLRKYGVSKEHRPNPIVQMGLFMDADGIPLSMSITPGNANETKCAIPLEEKLIKTLKNNKLIYCADAGLASYDIRKFNSFHDRAFIVTQSIKKLKNVLKEAVFNDYDYRLLSNDKNITIKELKEFDKTDPSKVHLYNDKAYKVIHADSLLDIGLKEEITLSDGRVKKVKSKAKLKQKVIITYSRKIMEYQRHIREGQIERARRLIKEDKVGVLKKGPNDVTRFIKKASKTKEQYLIDEKKIEEEERYDGYYAIATNLDDDVKTIIAINSQRYKIEDCFRVMKTNFGGRPLHHSVRNHIIAHFLICYASLLIYRLLEVQLDRKGRHFTTDQIITSIQNMNVEPINEIVSKAAYKGSQILQALTELYPALRLDDKYYLNDELKKKFKNISK